jgi:uncharacterized protein YbjT (DUF2867 family)
MRVVLFGATGMIGQAALRECLLDPEVEAVLAVGRAATGKQHDKLRELVRADLYDLSPVAEELTGYDACLFCLGVSSAGMKEADYRRVTYDLTLGAARLLAERNPESTFVYVSGAGTGGTSMWARVKGETESALLELPIDAYMFRPGYIQPLHGVTSRTRLYAALYVVAKPLYPVLRRLFPKVVTTSELLARAMLRAAKTGAPKRVLETPDIHALAA